MPLEISLNTFGEAVSGVSVRLTATGSANVAIENLVETNNTLADWSYPVKQVYKDGPHTVIDLAAVNVSTTGYVNNTDEWMFKVKTNTGGLPENASWSFVFQVDNEQTKVVKKTDPCNLLAEFPSDYITWQVENYPAPVISGWSGSRYRGDSLTINGQWFGDGQNSQVLFSRADGNNRIVDIAAPTGSWTENSIQVTTPNNAVDNFIQVVTPKGIAEINDFYPKTSFSTIVKMQGINQDAGEKEMDINMIDSTDNSLVYSGRHQMNWNNTFNKYMSGWIEVLGFQPFRDKRLLKVIIKPKNHLAYIINDMSLTYGEKASYDISPNVIPVSGDVNDDNKLDITDIAQMLGKYTALEVLLGSGEFEDLNGDGKLDIRDIAIILGNYTQLVLEGDPINR